MIGPTVVGGDDEGVGGCLSGVYRHTYEGFKLDA